MINILAIPREDGIYEILLKSYLSLLVKSLLDSFCFMHSIFVLWLLVAYPVITKGVWVMVLFPNYAIDGCGACVAFANFMSRGTLLVWD